MKEKISYDLKTLPPGMTAEKVFEFFEKRGILIYDSAKGNKPEVIISNEGDIEIEFKDVTFGIPDEEDDEIEHLREIGLQRNTGTMGYVPPTQETASSEPTLLPEEELYPGSIDRETIENIIRNSPERDWRIYTGREGMQRFRELWEHHEAARRMREQAHYIQIYGTAGNTQQGHDSPGVHHNEIEVPLQTGWFTPHSSLQEPSERTGERETG